MLQFNARGLLTPNLNIASNRNELEHEFVENIDSEKRKYLFSRYVEYSTALKKELTISPLLQWIDGSFVSKKENPDDIDLVNFVSYEEIKDNERRLDHYKYPSSLTNFEIDAYIVLIYPREHPNYPLYVGDRLYWMDLFDKTKRNRSGIKHPKGFLELHF